MFGLIPKSCSDLLLFVGMVVLDSMCGPGAIALCNVIPVSVLSSFNGDLQSTLLNLVQECLGIGIVRNKKVFDLEAIFRRLAVVQDREPRDILNYVLKLWQLKLVHVVGMVFEKGLDLLHIDLWKGKRVSLKLWLYEKILQEVLCKNPQLQTYCHGFSNEQSSLQYIRVLRLDGCGELEHLDLREFPSLRSLDVMFCPKFNLVTGWEAATGLGSIYIVSCPSYRDFSEVQYLFSLREITILREIVRGLFSREILFQ